MNIIRLNSIGEPFAKSGQATPPSGGGTEGGSGADMMYIDVSFLTGTQGYQSKKMLMMFATDAVYDMLGNGELWYGPAAYVEDATDDSEQADKIKRLSFNLSQKLRMLIEFDDCPTVGDALKKIGFTIDSPFLADYIITESEFYTV